MSTKESSLTLAKLPGLGPKSAAVLNEIEITSVEQFMALDPFEIYRRLKHQQAATSLNFLYAMIGAQQGVLWQQVMKEQKSEILIRLDDMGLAPVRKK